MKEYEIAALKNDTVNALGFENELQLCFPVMQELRTHLTFENFLLLYTQAHEHEGYKIITARKNKKIVGLMGYRILHDFVHGKHLYIDDLVSTQTERSNGIGSALLDYAEKLAALNGCTGLRLCTGIDNELGKKFYEKNNLRLRAVVYKKKLQP